MRNDFTHLSAAEIERLKWNQLCEEQKALCARAADALERTLGDGERFEPSMVKFIAELRKAPE